MALAKVAVGLHLVALQWTLGDMRGVAQRRPTSTRHSVISVTLKQAVWRHHDGCWRPEPVTWNMRRHRGGSGDKRVGSEKASLQRPSGDPPCCPWPPWGGWPSGALTTVADAMFIGYSKYCLRWICYD